VQPTEENASRDYSPERAEKDIWEVAFHNTSVNFGINN
jgi:hypothetical protein